MLNMPKNVPQDTTAEQAPRKKRLKGFLKTLLILIFIGYIIGFINDPFIYIIYSQLVFLFIAISIMKTAKINNVFLSFLILLMVSLALKKIEISVALVILYLVMFAGRSLVKESRRRRIFYFSSTVLIVSIYFLIFIVSHMSAKHHPLNDQSSKLESMKSLPYLSHVDDKDKKKEGVVKYDQDLCASGLNLYNSYYKPGAYLLDMAGNIRHTWLPQESHSNWQYVTACENGDLLVCIEDELLMRLNWDSQILWQKEMRTHHEIAVAENKDIYTLTSTEEVVFTHLMPVPIINDSLVILSSDGTIKKNISLFNLLKKDISLLNIIKIYSRIINPQDLLWKAIKSKLSHRLLLPRITSFDPFHTNSITIIDKNIEGWCKKGDVLISMRSLNLVGIVDIEKEKMKWTWGPGYLEEQHNPTFLENGNILIFDNGTRRKYSRLIELDPLKNQIVWEYHNLNLTPFFTDWGGSAQRLQNGNTLITETSKGRVFEITKDGEIVWEFNNPDKQGNGKKGTIYRMTRITDPHLVSIMLGNVEKETP